MNNKNVILRFNLAKVLLKSINNIISTNFVASTGKTFARFSDITHPFPLSRGE